MEYDRRMAKKEDGWSREVEIDGESELENRRWWYMESV